MFFICIVEYFHNTGFTVVQYTRFHTPRLLRQTIDLIVTEYRIPCLCKSKKHFNHSLST